MHWQAVRLVLRLARAVVARLALPAASAGQARATAGATVTFKFQPGKSGVRTLSAPLLPGLGSLRIFAGPLR